MPDGDHSELSFDPLDDTKLWPEDQFPKRRVGRMVLNRNPENVFAETEQIAFGTGVLVDGMDFSDDKMLLGRTLSYSDTQRYRVGPNYLQLPSISAQGTRAHQPARRSDGAPGPQRRKSARQLRAQLRWAACANRRATKTSTGCR